EPRAHRPGPAAIGDEVVELEQVDTLHLKSPETRLERGGDGLADWPVIGGLDPELRADQHGGGACPGGPPQVPLRLAVTVGRRGVEVVDPELDGARHRALLIGRRTPDHQAADIPAPEPQRRDLETRRAQAPQIHPAAPSTIARNLANARSRGRYFIPQ